ncbi:hypothetical protein L202_06278 [Cryptococcus amylolentus CBS 6039]|uniref:dolichol kinase n=1 Tax=Cryptococcus amylolentus CBS 6039 TaxID=1295533 RepID=A0A1E3HFC7_9TREE|nr:hypothetical protein L202_06278 [Cryptococcus amylolentus CBS 6039]ODN75059.1 hypothetical protein L202_06278 [Cryptococcus amylolentus CBS 6039]
MTLQPARSHHTHRNTRHRSVSRSSSSPSPPPPSSLSVHGHPPRTSTPLHNSREKRKSFNSPRSSATGSVGHNHGHGHNSHRTRAPSRSPLPPFYKSPSDLPSSPLASRTTLEDQQDHETTDVGFSTQYGASASSVAGAGSGSEVEFLRGDETEVERASRVNWKKQVDEPVDRTPTPLASARTSNSARRQNSAPPSPPPHTLLPFMIGLNHVITFKLGGKTRRIGLSMLMTRRKCENLLVLSAVCWGIWVLGYRWGEQAIAGEIGLLVGLTILYSALRFRPTPARVLSTYLPPTRPLSPSPVPPSTWGGTYPARERSARASVGHASHSLAGVPLTSPALPKDDPRARMLLPDEDGYIGIGHKGSIWGTEEREYRDCLDDGIYYALLLGPLVASALLHASLSQLFSYPSSPLPHENWKIENPLVLPTTPLRRDVDPTRGPIETIRALSALATSRRNLVQLFTLCSFVLLVHLARSLHLEIKQMRLLCPPPNDPSVSELGEVPPGIRSGHGGGGGGPNSVGGRFSAQQAGFGTFWLRKGEWRRTGSVVGFSALVSAGCLGVKAVTAYVGRGVWSDMSPSDIVIATLFYQFSIYVCVRLARKGLTLGELASVCSAATAMFMEVVNLTRMKIAIFRTPYIKTYRLPTPLLTFQLALIPGSLLAGFLLSPLLYLSRNLAQKPAHRLRLPHEKPIHRRLLALGFYGGSAVVCGGLVGGWTWWCLGGRNPYSWVFWFVFGGRHMWTRLGLVGYWVGLAIVSVAGWERQLNRARRHKRYTVPGTAASRGDAPSSSNSNSNSSNQTHPSVSTSTSTLPNAPSAPGHPGQTAGQVEGRGQAGLSGAATQMMDAADQRMPTLSVNARRKSFHALAVIMFIPGIAVDPAFTHLSFSVAFAAFNFAEYIRYFALWPFGVKVHLFLNEFLDAKDSGTAILSHFYLLAGCSSPLWFEGPSELLSYFGVLSLGIGDALASIVGRRIGRLRWCPAFGKTVEGSLAFFLSVLVSSVFMWAVGAVDSFNLVPYTITVAFVTLLEAFSAQNDNLILPMIGWAVGTLLSV